MKVLHIAAAGQLNLGIVRQMVWEQQAADALGILWNSRIYCPGSSVSNEGILIYCDEASGIVASSFWRRLISRILFKRAFFAWLRSVADNYDLILLRHNVCSFGELLFVRKYRKKVLTVHHTLELPELWMARGWGRRIVYALMEKILGGAIVSTTSGLVGVTPEIVTYEKSRAAARGALGIVYPNGVLDTDYAEAARKPVLSGPKVSQLLFVASSFVSWHGLDILLVAVSESRRNFVLHVVGDILSEEDAEMASQDPRVTVHGRLSPSEIAELAAQCDVGLASFALYRKGMSQACTLKVREYLLCGLPVYSGHDDVFPKAFSYYRKGPPNIDSILDFSEEVSGVDRREIVKSAEPFISKKIILKSLYDRLLFVFGDK